MVTKQISVSTWFPLCCVAIGMDSSSTALEIQRTQKWFLWLNQPAMESHGEPRQEVMYLSPPFTPCLLDLSG